VKAEAAAVAAAAAADAKAVREKADSDFKTKAEADAAAAKATEEVRSSTVIYTVIFAIRVLLSEHYTSISQRVLQLNLLQ
jgi:hypothetical protein